MPFVVTNTGTNELDYEGASRSGDDVHRDRRASRSGNIFQRALFAWRFRDYNLLVSGQIDDDSRIMIYRDIRSACPSRRRS